MEDFGKKISRTDAYITSRQAVSAITEKYQAGKMAWLAKIYGYDGMTFRRHVIAGHIDRKGTTKSFNLKGDGLYQAYGFRTACKYGRAWNPYFLVEKGKVWMMSASDAVNYAKQLESEMAKY